MSTYSHSRIGSFETCPLQYKLAYIDRVKVEAEDTIETYLGIRVHEALEKLYRDLQHEKLMSLEELLETFRKQWVENWKDTILLVKKEYGPENYRKMGERQLADYYKRYHPFDQGRVIGLETHDTLNLDEDGTYRFHIRIDRLMDMGDGLYEIHDYKTGMTLPKQEDLDQDRQLAMYALWVRENFRDFKRARLVWHFLAFDKEMASVRTVEELEHTRDEVIEKIRVIEQASDFPAQVSWLCDWCLYKPICPMWSHGVELDQMPENAYMKDPGRKLVDTYVKIKSELDAHRREAEAELEKLKEALVAFCKSRGVQVVFGSEAKITVKETEALRLPPKNTKAREELIRTLQQIGRLDDVSDLDVYALTRILQQRRWEPTELERLSPYVSREKTYRLSVSKK
ncbi:MAG: RecB family exonuclease [Candidatus Aminicenantales bacterium]